MKAAMHGGTLVYNGPVYYIVKICTYIDMGIRSQLSKHDGHQILFWINPKNSAECSTPVY